MPIITGMEYLLHHLRKMGWYKSNGMGIEPLPWSEIEAYNNCHNFVLNESEMDIIRDMSSAYVSHVQDRNPNKKPPYKLT